ncbi:MAG TPA: helix-turn-helix domain-containing protein, partial [Paludibacteraceae bacterium]|nr:helix-turn-helix domain-containing protein [Paludibacteraceae bacterium]
MERKFEFQKVCQYCGQIFTALNSTTKYCSKTCANRAGKEEKRLKRLNEDSNHIKEKYRQNLLSKDLLSITQAAYLLGVSRPTIYKMIANNELFTYRFTERIVRIKRTDLEQKQLPLSPVNTPISEIQKQKEKLISKKEALEMFGISDTWFYKKIKSADLSPTFIDGKAFYSINMLKKLFIKQGQQNISEWYSLPEIMDKFKVSRQYIYDYTSDHKIPKKRQGKGILISKYHWDKARGL